MNIYITDGNNRASLAITRSLGRRGHKIYVGEKQQGSIAGASKYCQSSFVYPNPALDSDGFIRVLDKQTNALSIDVIIPVADITTMLILENRDIFSGRTIPTADYAIVSAAADKDHVIRSAQELGIPVPETVVVKDKISIHSLSHNLPYPVVIKPSRSRVKKNQEWLNTVVSYANDLDDLKSKLSDLDPLAYPILLQERIPGPGIGIFTCYNDGKLIANFSHRRLREKPPSGGVSVLRESIPVDPIAGKYSQQLLDYLKWHGVAMVEFKLDERDHTPKLMEINGRFWGSLQLAIDAGVDFPALLLNTVTDNQIKTVPEYKNGVKTRWLCGDLDVLLMILFRSRSSLKLPKDHPGKLISFFRFMTFWGRNLHYEVLQKDDIMPFITEMRRWLRN